MSIDHHPPQFEDFPSPRRTQPPPVTPKPVLDLRVADHLRRLARSSVTPGILEGMSIRSADGGSTPGQASYLTSDPASRLTVGPTSYAVTVEPGTAVGADGELIELLGKTEVDLSPVLSTPSDAPGHIYVCQRTATDPMPPGVLRMSHESVRPQPEPVTEPQDFVGSTVCLHLPGEPVPRQGVPIASLKGDRAAGTLTSEIQRSST